MIRLEAIAVRLEAIAIRLDMIVGQHSQSRTGSFKTWYAIG